MAKIRDHSTLGQVAEAVRRCVETGQAWKAAMIEGHILYHAPELLGDEGEQEGNDFILRFSKNTVGDPIKKHTLF